MNMSNMKWLAYCCSVCSIFKAVADHPLGRLQIIVTFPLNLPFSNFLYQLAVPQDCTVFCKNIHGTSFLTI